MRAGGPYRESQLCRAERLPGTRRQRSIRTSRRAWPRSAPGTCGSRPLRRGGPPRPAAPGAAMGRCWPAAAMSAGRARPAGPEGVIVAVIGTWLSLAAGSGLACGTDPDLFFAESPQDVGRAKELCAAARCGPRAWPKPWTVASRGAYGAGSCCCAAPSCPPSGLAVAREVRARGLRPTGQVTWAGSAGKSSYSRLVMIRRVASMASQTSVYRVVMGTGPSRSRSGVR